MRKHLTSIHLIDENLIEEKNVYNDFPISKHQINIEDTQKTQSNDQCSDSAIPEDYYELQEEPRQKVSTYITTSIILSSKFQSIISIFFRQEDQMNRNMMNTLK